MSCGTCKEIEETDLAAPQCDKCPIPALDADNVRVMEMRSMIVSLKGLMDASVVVKAFGATMDDMRLLAALEREMVEHDRHAHRD